MPDVSGAHPGSAVPKLRVGLLVDSDSSSKYVYELARWAAEQDDIFISHLIIQKPKTARSKTLLDYFRFGLFALITKFENFRLKGFHHFRDHLKPFSLKEIVPAAIIITPEASTGGTVYRYSSEDVQKVKDLGLDVLVRCGSGILRGEILDAARLGIISFHHADNRVNRGVPPGFWEVYFKEDHTGFMIQKLTEELDGGNVLIRGRFQTRNSYLLNQAALYTKSNYYLKQVLKQMAVTGELPAIVESQPYYNPLFKLPSLPEQIKYAFRSGYDIAYNGVTRLILNRYFRWAVAYSRGDWKNLVMWRAKKIPNPPNHFLADPFVMSEGGRDYLFLEDHDYKLGRALICVYEITEQGAQRLGDIIVEPFHLSFPYLFRFNSKLYMCPETSENNDIRVYECVNFPLEWKLSKVLMSNVSAVDTMLFERDGLWWLITSIDPTNTGSHYSELFIFYSDSPLSNDWRPHRISPILIDSAKGRNAGILFDDRSIYRVSQRQGFGVYGKGISINRIDVLTPDEYLETEVCSVEPNFFPDIVGCHHMHSTGKITVFDFERHMRADR